MEAVHQHPHTHSPAGDDARMKRVLIVSLALTLGFVVFEAMAGLAAHSLALLSDAGHNFTDAFALLLAALGVYWQARPGDHTRTYGYQRAGVLAAFINALSLVLLAAVLFYESYQRLLHPEPVAANTMIVVASAALLLNLAIAWALGGHGHHHHDLNVRAAWLHMAGDAASSAAIILGALLIRYTGWQVIDPVLSILIGIAIVWSGWGIIRDSLNILLEGLPKGLQLKNVSGELSQVAGVIDVHDLHIWSLGSDSRALSCHVLIDDMPPSASDSILRQINDLLCARFQIRHTTVQFEHVKCILAETHCTSAIQAAPREHRH
ncbi:MAG: cation diffusion facilitator family transporter [Acidobacteriota bacterium]